ncbi:MAG: penicillin-binding protein [Sneathiella sp.]|jgi:penicillin-binding protein 1A|uniref:penicillin-binding protein 1A n=1 Tax=Sneathiella sp. TaxID=1964365 RepID=UPI000C464DAD|nr:penicillin-binding protein 1A [Sneathiella sp.]MAL79601.1 penicillin-binding protein [Sneathiella sp.]
MKRFAKFLFLSVTLLLIFGVLAAGVIGYGFYHFGRGLPEYDQLTKYEPPVMTRVHAADGGLIAEYAHQRRLFVPIDTIPDIVKQAFIAAEDQNYYSHPGVDFQGIARALFTNIKNIGQGRRPVGASTITQQVAKNMLLTNEVSYERKAKEAILALRINRALSKDQVLELYLNEIYLGHRAYGVAAAALYYFDKSLDQLTIAEAAYLGALPKAPNNYNPFRFPKRAMERRDYVIGRLLEDGYITTDQAEEAYATPLIAREGGDAQVIRAEWFVEQVRRELYNIYGEKALYDGGLSVRATMQTTLQKTGEAVLRKGLRDYDRRHGWRGPLSSIEVGEDWAVQMIKFPRPKGLGDWPMAVVLKLTGEAAEIGFADTTKGQILLEDMDWAREFQGVDQRGPAVKAPADVLKVGDIIAVSPKEGAKATERLFALEQIPKVSGALVAMDPHTGRVHALVGGWSADTSQFNRAVQAYRQPGSAFKPFVYAAALDNGFTPADKVMDGPFVLTQPNGERWKPSNYSNRFYGPSTLRLGIEKSRNLMTVRLARAIGMEPVVDYARRFGITDNLMPTLSMALGAGETTLLRLTTAYAELVNGGKQITPTLIDRVQDRRGKTIYRHDDRACESCNVAEWNNQEAPQLPDNREQILPATTAYQVVSMLEGVIERGTGRSISVIGKPLGGKTGTTNDSNDAWFVGFSPDLAVGVYVGFDTPQSLGQRETGSSVAAPIFRDFMAAALQDQPATPFRVPEGIRLVRINEQTGEPARRGDKNVIWEAFKATTGSLSSRGVLDGSEGGGFAPAAANTDETPRSSGGTIRSGTGGLY